MAGGEVEATIDTEVLQEILHRYRAIGRWEDGRGVFDFTRQIFPNVVPVTANVLDRGTSSHTSTAGDRETETRVKKNIEY